MDSNQVDAFWSKVEITTNSKDCWPWSGAKKPKGYGNVRVGGSYKIAHRVAFELAVGQIPEGMQVCHICDNPPCCNPHHLMLGSAKSNVIDMLIKNRQGFRKNLALGTRNANAKLTEDAVRAIRKAYASGAATQQELAEKHGVTQPCIGSIVRNQTWRHVI